YSGIPQFVNVPFAARVNKGLFSFTAQDTAKRIFDHWTLPDKTTSIERTVTWDIQADTRIEVHWQVTGENGDGGNNNLLIIGAVAILAVGGFVFLMMRRKK
ncbi:LPXTG cell wall anchor domain-containing protein, partial [Candidatus Bathyarchaeota archaeon]|nr:LPXTG cell wall anchor domain-containing protein [Candidatus Bathyarchaeota archaeon]